MPIHRGLNVVFVHIPKTGGSSVEAALRRFGPLELTASPSMPGPIWEQVGHSPQHLTLAELQSLDLLPAENFTCFAIVRHPVERVVSAYNYKGSAMPFDKFLDAFLDRSNAATRRWDGHQLSNCDYLKGADGTIPSWVHIVPYTSGSLLREVCTVIFGSDAVHQRQRARFAREVRVLKFKAKITVGELSEQQRQRICDFYSDDLAYFANLFA